MSPPATDVSATVEYSTDKWQMNQIPWALWSCVVGLAFCLNADDGGTRGVAEGAVVAFVYIALLGLAFAGWAGTKLIERSSYPWYLIFAIGLLIFIVIAAFISLFGSSPRYPAVGRLRWSQLVHPTPNVFGWMMLYLGGAWIAFALLRHTYPARPIIMLSPAGISFHRSWLRDLFIPWQDVQDVGPLVGENAGQAPTIYPHAMAVSVAKDFYDQHMAPKRSSFSPPGSEAMFRPKGSLMQMVLTSPELIVDFEDYRGPIDARWKAFRNQPRAAHPSAASIGAPFVYGRWSLDGSWWQAIMFLTPILGMAVVIMYASGLWPR